MFFAQWKKLCMLWFKANLYYDSLHLITDDSCAVVAAHAIRCFFWYMMLPLSCSLEQVSLSFHLEMLVYDWYLYCWKVYLPGQKRKHSICTFLLLAFLQANIYINHHLLAVVLNNWLGFTAYCALQFSVYLRIQALQAAWKEQPRERICSNGYLMVVPCFVLSSGRHNEFKWYLKTLHQSMFICCKWC